MPSLEFDLVDVFSDTPFSGNSLPVFFDAPRLSAAQMLRITQELRHFEAIFVCPEPEARCVTARVFDLFEELPFAGHPIIGAAAVLAARGKTRGPQAWQFRLPDKTVTVDVEPAAGGYSAWLDQGRPEFLGEIDDPSAMADAFSIKETDLHPSLPVEIVSTGLRYMIIPLRPGVIAQARIRYDLGAILAGHGAQYAVLLDEAAVEIRHWNNDGVLEDVATGSAAGTIGAYRLRHGLVRGGDTFELSQGRFTGRPSRHRVRPVGDASGISTVLVGGHVAAVGGGSLIAAPADLS